MSMPKPNAPIIVGVGQFLNRIESLEQGARAADGTRTWVNIKDRDLTAAMVREEFCGRRVALRGGRMRVAA